MRSLNIRFPLQDNTDLNTFFGMNYVTKDLFNSDLLFLLLTDKGERYYDSDFGCNLNKFLFDPNDDTTVTDIEEEIKNTVSKYIPKLTIKSITFNKNEDDPTISEHQVNINIKFTYDEGVFVENGELNINI
jgi:phage baseplate assembly protein W